MIFVSTCEAQHQWRRIIEVLSDDFVARLTQRKLETRLYALGTLERIVF